MCHLSFLSVGPAWLGGTLNHGDPPIFIGVVFLFSLSSIFLLSSTSVPATQTVYPVVPVGLVETCSWQMVTHKVHSSRCVPADRPLRPVLHLQQRTFLPPPFKCNPSTDVVITCSPFMSKMIFLNITAAVETCNKILRVLAHGCKTWKCLT